MRKCLLLCAPLFVVWSLGADNPKEYDDKTIELGIEGTWHLVSLKRGGVEDASVPGWDLVFQGKKYSWVLQQQVVVVGDYQIHTSSTPAQLDMRPGPGGGTNRAIFRIDGDTLLMALFEPEDKRPRNFSDNGTKIIALKRVKK